MGDATVTRRSKSPATRSFVSTQCLYLNSLTSRRCMYSMCWHKGFPFHHDMDSCSLF